MAERAIALSESQALYNNNYYKKQGDHQGSDIEGRSSKDHHNSKEGDGEENDKRSNNSHITSSSLDIKNSNIMSKQQREDSVRKKSLKGRNRLMSLRKSSLDDKFQTEFKPDSENAIQCIFVAGLYYDVINQKHATFTRDIFPPEFELPDGIGDICFPDSDHWIPLSIERNKTYNVIMTAPDGIRTNVFCQRVFAEGDTVCLPLAICILSKKKDRKFHSEILNVISKKYGNSDISTSRLFSQVFYKKNNNFGIDEISFKNVNQTEKKKRKSQKSLKQEKSILESLFSAEDLYLLFSAILREKRILFLSNDMSDLSQLFEELEWFISPFLWQHALIPILPSARIGFLEAPTPYIIGLFQQSAKGESIEDFWENSVKGYVDSDPDVLAIGIRLKSNLERSYTILKTVQSGAETSQYHCLPKPMVKEVNRNLLENKWRKSTKSCELKIIKNSLARSFHSLFSNVMDFVIYDETRGRAFKTQNFLDFYFGTEYYDFLFEFVQTAMFGNHVRKIVEKIDSILSFEATNRRLMNSTLSLNSELSPDLNVNNNRKGYRKKSSTLGNSVFYQ